MKARLANKILTILNFLKIRQKLLAMYCIAFLMPLVLIAVVMSWWLYGILEKWQIAQAQTSLSQTAILFQDMIQSTEELSDSLIIDFSCSTWVKATENSFDFIWN